MSDNGADQRTLRRFNMNLPVQVRAVDSGESMDAVTRDVSARGVFITLGAELEENSKIEFTLTLPPEITMTRNVRVHCTGHVVRVAREAGGPMGIAAQIDHYRFVPERAAEAK